MIRHLNWNPCEYLHPACVPAIAANPIQLFIMVSLVGSVRSGCPGTKSLRLPFVCSIRLILLLIFNDSELLTQCLNHFLSADWTRHLYPRLYKVSTSRDGHTPNAIKVHPKIIFELVLKFETATVLIFWWRPQLIKVIEMG